MNNKIKSILAVLVIISMIIPAMAVGNANSNKAQNVIGGVEIAPGVFYLGQSMDKGQVIEGYAFVHYAKDSNEVKKSKPVWDDTVDTYKLMYGGIKWANTMTYEVNFEGSILNQEVVKSTLQTSLETWDSKTSFSLFGPPITLEEELTPGSLDYRNIVVWRNLAEIYGANVIAVNSFWFNPATKEILDSDVTFSTNFEWSLSGESGKMDLQNIATHEFGHNGLKDLYTVKTTELTMYGYSDYGETKKQDLGTGDISGIQALYGE